ncbi:MAG TPA: FG-GAP and VCBS repeat-containing protein, partial [Cyclobacteriaceae bacterium]|nr:FG-GAP and VCBS repeat-containing protein [Cyclobacteriaceae bacterium]
MSLRLFSCYFSVSTFLFLAACNSQQSTSSERQYSEQAIKGKQLSEKYCISCHLHPDPSLLNKESWKSVLPVMQREINKSLPISVFDWMAIEDYYNEASPSELEKISSDEPKEITSQFKEQPLIGLPKDLNPNLTLVKYFSDDKMLCLGNDQGELFLLHNKTENKVRINNIPIDVDFNHETKEIIALGIGNIYPSQDKKGELISIDSAGNSHTIIDSLIRPVHFSKHDFNSDGQGDFLISSFGSLGKIYYGKLSLYISFKGKFKEQIIKELPGAIKTVIGDFNNDKQPDIIALFSQGRESIIIFLNKGDLKFEEKLIAEFPPVYGTNNFTLADINNDSYPDIISTNGDNGDFSQVFKSYHGVRILINDGNNKFEEKYFFPINGASKVIADDFDKDNDIDLTILASYPNLKDRPQETLVYLENSGDLNFNSSYIEKQPSGKWLLMDAGDLDNDGFPDLIVGANLMNTIGQPEFYEQQWKTNKKSILILKNMGEG